MPRLTGYVYRPDGTPAENATVAVPRAQRFALADETGHFDLGEIPPGHYIVQVVHRAYPKQVVEYDHTQATELIIPIEI